MTEIASSSLHATAEFYERSAGVKFFRTALSATDVFAPKLAARFAQQLFLTPLPPKWFQRGQAWNPSWAVQSLPFEGASLTLYRRLSASSDGLTDGLELDRPHVLLIHGWGGSAAQMQALASAIAERGLVPVVIEAPAHGKSRGLRSSLPQFARAIEYVATRLALSGVRIQGVVAHSLGASAAAYAVAHGVPATPLVLLAPPDRPRDFTKMFAQVFGLSERTRARMQSRIEAKEAALMEAYAASHLGPKIASPILIVHDESDPINVFSGAKRWLAESQNARLFATIGLGHRRILRERAVIDAVADFVNLS